MLADTEIRKLFDSPLMQKVYAACDDPKFPAALPDASLQFLLTLARQLEVTTLFEFGSGHSTIAFLQAGFSVSSLEDSKHWMKQTMGQLSDTDKRPDVSFVRPLRPRMCGLMPVMDWPIDRKLAAKIRNADLILVDSPFFPPFRESTLWSALLNNDHAVIVLDDTRIPTLRRFCDRIAAANPALLHCRVQVGHTFDIFCRLHSPSQLKRAQTILEVLKGWRRFFISFKR